jgi:hypothetical protein
MTTSSRTRCSRGHGCTAASLVIGSTTVVVLVVLMSLASPAAASVSLTSKSRRPHRILIVSVPTLTWSDLEGGDAPNLSRFLDSAAVADLATRADRQPAKLGAAYVTIGAGTRAAGDDSSDGEGLASSERFGNASAGAAYQQRTGLPARAGLVDLGIARVDGANANLLYEAHPGELGDMLTRAGYRRSVVANGDGTQPDASDSALLYFRSAVGALMGSFGRVPNGTVGRQLLRRDAAAPYGVRFDDRAVERAFLAGWTNRSVSLVEASDLVRADRYSALATSAGNERLRRAAIRSSDRLFGRLLGHVDPGRDAVLVVAPVPRSGDRSVTVAGLRAPGIRPGLLRSATTRRSGYVTLADIAPTVLDLLSLPVPTTMEGRPMRVDPGHGDASARLALLERANANGLLRDDLVNPVTAAVLWTAMVLAIACVLLLTVARSLLLRFLWIRPALRWLSLAAVGFVLATLPVTLLDLGEHGGKAAFWLFLSLFAVLFAAVCQFVGRRRALDPLLAALTLLLTVLVIDQFTGGHLEFNSVFGYSATVGIRFSGIGNQSSAVLSTAAVLVASFVAWRFPTPWGTRAALVVLALAFLALTPPLFGQDFGGTLASAPAFGLLGWLVLGRRLTVKAVMTLVGILLASGLVVGFLDLLRPSDQRTHVGRFFEKVGNEGFSGFSTVIERKSGENAATFSSTIYLVLIVVVLAAGVALWLRPPRPLATAVARVPTLRAAALSLTVLILLSYGLNDSGLAIPAIMLALVAVTATYLVADVPAGTPLSGPPAPTMTSGRTRDPAPTA